MKKIVFLSNYQNQAVTFFHPSDENYYVGYRFLEGTPEISENINQDYSLQPVSSFQERIHKKINSVDLGAVNSYLIRILRMLQEKRNAVISLQKIVLQILSVLLCLLSGLLLRGSSYFL